MSGQNQKKVGNSFGLWDWFKNGLVQVVPEDIAFCAYDCREPECRHGEWETCEKRLLGGAVYVAPAAPGRTSG